MTPILPASDMPYVDRMTTDTSALLERARAWAADDPDPVTRAELDAIVADVADGGDPTDLADRFAGTLTFGTAGLRGAARRRPQRDEPRRGHPGRGRPGRLPGRPGRRHRRRW